MPKDLWVGRFQSWFNWYDSGAGPYHNGTGGNPAFEYHIKNFNYAYNPFYASEGTKMVTLSEGQSYGMWYALMADDLPAFVACYAVTLLRHQLDADGIADARYKQPWSSELMDFMDNEGRSIFDVIGPNPTIRNFGWVWSEDYSTDPGNQSGLASMYLAPDGDLVFIACLLMAYERWNVREFLFEAQAMLTDFAEYGVRKCGSRYALTMGQYRGGGGFTLPMPPSINLNAGSVFPIDDVLIINTADLTTGDACRFYGLPGCVPPGGLAIQDSLGESWPKYYLRVNESYNMTFFNTKADAIANTNKIDVTSVGSGNMILVPYETQGGQVGTNPSYLIPPFFRLFAQYDPANVTIWSDLAANSYTDISNSCSLNFHNMFTYLNGINIATGAREFFRAGGDSAAHQLDAIRVAINMAFDSTEEAKNVLKTQCQFNSGTQKWEPKTGYAGGVWRFWLNSGFIPNTFSPTPVTLSGAPNANTTNDTIELAVGYLSSPGVYSNGVRFTASAGLPSPLNTTTVYWPRLVSGITYSLHPTQADANANTNKINLTTTGSGTVTFVTGYQLTSASINTTTGVITTIADLTYGTGDVCRFVPNTGGTNPAPLGSNTSYYMRILSLRTFTLHTTSAGAIANNNKVTFTNTGTGSDFLMTFHAVAPVGWYYRGGIGGLDLMSPYGAAQIMAYKFLLNGYEDAEAFYNQLPTWITQQGDGSFVEGNGDYYPQHPLGLLSAVMSGDAYDHYNSRGYLQFNNITDAQTALTGIQNALAVQNYGKLLSDGSGNYLVPVVGPRAYDTLSTLQKGAIIKTLPSNQWSVVA